MKKLVLTWLLLQAGTAWAQLPTNSFAVTTPCPATSATASTLHKINTDGSMTAVGEIRAGSTPIVLNGLGYNNADRTVLYGLQVKTPTVADILNNVPPNLYRVDLATAEATDLGPATSPATPPASELTPAGSGETATDLRQTLNFVADSDPNSVYYLGGATFRVLAQSFFGFPLPATARVTDVRLYVGTMNLTSPGEPTWRRLDTSDPATAAIVEDYRVRTEAYIRANFTGPVPDGGIQDWVYDKATGNLLSYIGQSDQYLTITNPGSSPAGITTTPTVALPPLSNGSADKNVGAMFCDYLNNVYVVRSATGDIFKISSSTGDYMGEAFGAVLGCNRGDAVSFADALPLPVTLTRFGAAAGPEGVRLTWTTASEHNVAYFEAERSPDGRRWQPAARVAASNRPTGRSYSALDATPPAGLVYYRLAMHDADGTVAYSAVQAVSRPGTVSVYPNPAHHQVQVQLSTAGAATLELLNAQGQVVRQQATSATGPTQLTTSGLPGGLYLLRVRQGGATSTTRVVLAGS